MMGNMLLLLSRRLEGQVKSGAQALTGRKHSRFRSTSLPAIRAGSLTIHFATGPSVTAKDSCGIGIVRKVKPARSFAPDLSTWVSQDSRLTERKLSFSAPM